MAQRDAISWVSYHFFLLLYLLGSSSNAIVFINNVRKPKKCHNHFVVLFEPENFGAAFLQAEN